MTSYMVLGYSCQEAPAYERDNPAVKRPDAAPRFRAALESVELQ
jgi:hypothetical protein